MIDERPSTLYIIPSASLPVTGVHAASTVVDTGAGAAQSDRQRNAPTVYTTVMTLSVGARPLDHPPAGKQRDTDTLRAKSPMSRGDGLFHCRRRPSRLAPSSSTSAAARCIPAAAANRYMPDVFCAADAYCPVSLASRAAVTATAGRVLRAVLQPDPAVCHSLTSV